VLPEVGIFADGVAVAQIGKTTFELCREYVDDVITVSNAEICAAIKDLFNDTRSISEPAGALGLAGLKKYVETTGVRDQTLMTIETGANVNFDKLRYISDQAEIGERCEAIYAVETEEYPGCFREFVMALDDHNITEFNYRYIANQTARIFVGIQITEGWDERRRLVKTLTDKKYNVIDLTEDEVAKGHVRHMVGGHTWATDVKERVFLIEFPERKGALIGFLNALNDRWNVSLFHYRSEGSLYGRVMVGFHVEDSEREDLTAALDTLGYQYREKTDNPAYKHFLS
jgi:threonine dehydratase